MPTVLEKKLLEAAHAIVETADQFQARLRGVEDGVRLELATVGAQIQGLRSGLSAERQIQDGRDAKLWEAVDDIGRKFDAIDRKLQKLLDRGATT